MRKKFLLVIVAMLIFASGLSAMATPYAVYCAGDLSLHLLDSDTELIVGGTLESNSQEITNVWEIDLVNPYYGNSSPWVGASQATKVIIEESFQTVRPISCRCWFYNFKVLTEITGLEYLYTEDVTDMSSMFLNCTALTCLDLDYENFKTSNVTDMHAMFCGCSKLTELYLYSSTYNVTDMSSMFSGCQALSQLYLGNTFSTANATNMSQMFSDCKSLTSLSAVISKLNTAKVTDMSLLFKGCSGLTELDLSKFNTENVTSMRQMFSGCSSLASIDLSNFNTGNVTDMYAMFRDCYKLTTVDLSMFNTENVTSMTSMFNGCSSLNHLDLSNFVNSHVPNLYRMFFNCSNLSSIVLGDNFCTANITGLEGLFYNCSNLTKVDLSNFNTENVTTMWDMFRDCSSLTELDLSSFNTGKVTTMGSMFSGCSSLTELNLSSFNTGKVTTMGSMFSGCSGLTELDLSKFNTGNVTGMASMFYGCSGLTELDLSNFNTEKVTDMNSMFYNCSSLISLNIKYFSSPNGGTTVNDTFSGCDNMRFIDFSQEYNISDLVPASTTWRPMTFYPETGTILTNFPNHVVGTLCRHLEIDGTEAGYHQLLLRIPYEITAKKVTIKRAFEKDKPYTLYLPFAMDASQYGTFYTDGRYDEATSSVYFTKLTADQTEANTPYMFIPAQDFPDGIVFEGEVAVSTTPEDTEANGLNGLYEKREFTADEAAQKIYYGWANGEFLWAEEGAKVDACRAYFRLPASAAAKAPARIKAIFGDDATGVTEIDEEEGNADLYNLNGQRVGNDYRGIVVKKGAKTATLSR